MLVKDVWCNVCCQQSGVWLQELQKRGKNTNSGAGPASTSGRIDPASDYGLGLEDSWDLTDDAYTPFPGNGGATAPTDSMPVGQWSASPSLNMAASSELWNRVTTVSLRSQQQ
jgi:hypothetical protein